jgi:hypothetical protein
MKGTEKQIAFAKEILRGAKIWFESPKVHSDAQAKAVEVLELVESKEYEKAEILLEESAPWPTMYIVDGEDGSPVVDASKIINSHLKNAYYCAKDNGLL